LALRDGRGDRMGTPRWWEPEGSRAFPAGRQSMRERRGDWQGAHVLMSRAYAVSVTP